MDIGAVEAGPVTIVVNTLVDEGQAPIIDGTATSLREAIAFADADAYAGDTITFAPGLQGSLALSQGALPAITGDFAIAGPGANRLTIDAQGKAGILSITSGAVVTVFGLTLADGSADFGGGAIINHGSLALTGCTVSGNTAHDLGGGIDNYGTLALTGCTVSGNTADFYGVGGGIDNSGTMTLTDCTVAGNTADLGGGGLYNSGTLTLTDCTVAGNAADAAAAASRASAATSPWTTPSWPMTPRGASLTVRSPAATT